MFKDKIGFPLDVLSSLALVAFHLNMEDTWIMCTQQEWSVGWDRARGWALNRALKDTAPKYLLCSRFYRSKKKKKSLGKFNPTGESLHYDQRKDYPTQASHCSFLFCPNSSLPPEKCQCEFCQDEAGDVWAVMWSQKSRIKNWRACQR